jgi:hypothetical protein
LGGSNYADIRIIGKMSNPSFYASLWKVIHAINHCPHLQIKLPSTPQELRNVQLGFETRSDLRVMAGCVGALDGWLCVLNNPRLTDALNTSDYFSGHYHTYGLNVQAMCDSECKFLYFDILNPGWSSDWTAYGTCSLRTWIENLPDNLFVAADNAYVCSEHLIVPFSGSNRGADDNSNFNFYLSQLQIRIEMAFGLLVGKWRIFPAPLECGFRNISKLVLAAAQLHNFCFTQRIDARASSSMIEPITPPSGTNNSTKWHTP